MQQIFIEAYNLSIFFSPKNWGYKSKQNQICDFKEQTFWPESKTINIIKQVKYITYQKMVSAKEKKKKARKRRMKC